MSGAKHELPWASLFVGSMGSALIAAAVVADFTGQPSEATIGFAFIGAGLVIAGPLLNRLNGILKIRPTGLEIPIGEPPPQVTISESQLKRGELVSANQAFEVTAIATGTGRVDAAAAGEEPAPTKTPVGAPDGGRSSKAPSEDSIAVMVHQDGTPPVFFTQAANDVLNSLGPARKAVSDAVQTLGTTDADHRIASTSTGVTYMERKVPPDLALIYRLIDKTSEDEPDQYVVVAIERGPERKRWWPDDIKFWP
ncbi:hypothetical protein FZI85_29925 [Mycobacterium sp. CBMA293]|uniref:hypothetical protein n=1 Tax=unclassified Mycolicibacterium TaxID=2636767 RepID=UPI0012DDE000|nr:MULTISPECIES: hypothetical protein [unclassified Mycolicibacterium]QGT51762.1 hypothetical protein pCBMA213_3_00020 [Mycolicibacterium sp.]MUL50057.1 hypothetical protein [Mycolicibacterium sp. CBMA 360]MUL62743.1 hypothetical protein [Mycolicibacterium sp. CBMA 335]MUL69613.1 hypothetical protein [Mycolicibacterium sp. CBMA 311]MUL97399.1 hypothetical protein [Mycolicibacterium sp. CBMA 230]